MPLVKIAILLVSSIGLAYLSRDSLRSPGVHGFYRFFAWESILFLLVINVQYWFADPLATPQIVSWVLLVLSAYFVLAGVLLLRRHGRARRSREDVPLVGLEKTTALVSEGIYRRVRHPLYGSLLFLAWGIFFKHPGWLQGCLAVAASIFLVAAAKAEEGENLSYFGEAYSDYMQRTKRFIPFVY